MTKSKIVLLFILCFTLSPIAYAKYRDTVKFSITAGGSAVFVKSGSTTIYGSNVPMVVAVPGEHFPKINIGASCAFLVDIPICKYIFINTGISYEYIHSEFSLDPSPYAYNLINVLGFQEAPYTNYLSDNDIEVPVLLKFDKKNGNNVYGALGVDAVYNIHSSLTIIGYENNYQDDFILSSVHDNLLGLNCTGLIGKHFNIGTKQFFAEIQYAQDIINWNYKLVPLFNYPYSDPRAPLKNYSLSFIIGWAL